MITAVPERRMLPCCVLVAKDKTPPVGPCGPAGPAGPAGPGFPMSPVDPCWPAGPGGPTAPAGPAAPAAPAAAIRLQLGFWSGVGPLGLGPLATIAIYDEPL